MKKIDSKHFDDEDSDGSDDMFQYVEDQTAGIMQHEVDDPTKLIDLELIKLLKYCYQMQKVRE